MCALDVAPAVLHRGLDVQLVKYYPARAHNQWRQSKFIFGGRNFIRYREGDEVSA